MVLHVPLVSLEPGNMWGTGTLSCAQWDPRGQTGHLQQSMGKEVLQGLKGPAQARCSFRAVKGGEPGTGELVLPSGLC